MSVEIDLCRAPAGLMSASVVLLQRCVQSVPRSVSSTGVELSPRFPWLSQRLAHCGSPTHLLQTHRCPALTRAAGYCFEPGARLRSASRRPVVFLCQLFENNNNPRPGRPENKVQSKEWESGASIHWCQLKLTANFFASRFHPEALS